MRFTFKGISNEEMGVIVSKRPPLKTPQQRMHFYNVDGTYGSTSQFQGYEPIENSMEIIVESEDFVDKVKGWLTGRGKFTRSDRPNMSQDIWFLDVMEFTKLPNTDVFTGVLKWYSFYPIWSLEEGEVSLTPISHSTSWNFAYKIINKGTTTTYPILIYRDAQKGDIKIGHYTIKIEETASVLEINTYSGEIYKDGNRDDWIVEFGGTIRLEPGETVIYSDKNLSTFKIINPSSYL